MPKKRQQNIVRTDYLENWIGFYRAHREYVKAETLTKVARDIGAPIDVEEVERYYHLHYDSANYVKVDKDQMNLFPV